MRLKRTEEAEPILLGLASVVMKMSEPPWQIQGGLYNALRMLFQSKGTPEKLQEYTKLKPAPPPPKKE